MDISFGFFSKHESPINSMLHTRIDYIPPDRMMSYETYCPLPKKICVMITTDSACNPGSHTGTITLVPHRPNEAIAAHLKIESNIVI